MLFGKGKRRLVSFYTRLIQLVLIASTMYFFYFGFSLGRKVPPKIEIKSECVCKDEEGNQYDFCYRLPENGKLGKRFDCLWLKHLKELGLTDESSVIDLEKERLPEPMFVTATSDNHWEEAKRLLALIRKHWRRQKVIIYDLGLSKETIEFISKLCSVELRKFDFDRYPKYVRELSEYRWKPIIIAETLKEFGAIWYMDSSITFKKANLSHVYQLVDCRKKEGFAKKPLASIEKRDLRENVTVHESGWDKKQWNENIHECRKAAYLFHGYTGHGIYPATSHHLYEWIPTNFDEIRKPKAKMYEAGFVFAVKTRDTVERILKWYVLCALEETCMAPRGIPNISLGCQWGKSRFADFANCHRFDQSVANLLAANGFHYDRHYYVSEIVDFFNVVRGAGTPWTPDYSCVEKGT